MNVAKYCDLGLGQIGVRFWCPGCDDNHVVLVNNPDRGWEFNGDLELPTITPSVLVNGYRNPETSEWNAKHPRCHSFITDGRIQFLSDCEHELANQTVPMAPIPT